MGKMNGVAVLVVSVTEWSPSYSKQQEVLLFTTAKFLSSSLTAYPVSMI
jgi:hypothetical protein